jgi:hypothetical protein
VCEGRKKEEVVKLLERRNKGMKHSLRDEVDFDLKQPVIC